MKEKKFSSLGSDLQLSGADSRQSNDQLYGDTEQFADLNFVKPASVRSRYCIHGSYFGVIPKKLPNGRLAWPI